MGENFNIPGMWKVLFNMTTRPKNHKGKKLTAMIYKTFKHLPKTQSLKHFVTGKIIYVHITDKRVIPSHIKSSYKFIWGKNVQRTTIRHFKKNHKQGFLEKWMIPDVGHKMYKMSPEHLVTPENKETTKSNGIILRNIIIMIISILGIRRPERWSHCTN